MIKHKVTYILLKENYEKLLSIVKRAANNSCCICCDNCLSCDAQLLLNELKEDKESID